MHIHVCTYVHLYECTSTAHRHIDIHTPYCTGSQLEERAHESGRTSEDVQVLSSRCTSAEADRARLTEIATTLEGRLAQVQQEVAILRAQAHVSETPPRAQTTTLLHFSIQKCAVWAR